MKFRGLNRLETKRLSIEWMRVAERANEEAEPRDGWVRIESEKIGKMRAYGKCLVGIRGPRRHAVLKSSDFDLTKFKQYSHKKFLEISIN